MSESGILNTKSTSLTDTDLEINEEGRLSENQRAALYRQLFFAWLLFGAIFIVSILLTLALLNDADTGGQFVSFVTGFILLIALYPAWRSIVFLQDIAKGEITKQTGHILRKTNSELWLAGCLVGLLSIVSGGGFAGGGNLTYSIYMDGTKLKCGLYDAHDFEDGGRYTCYYLSKTRVVVLASRD